MKLLQAALPVLLTCLTVSLASTIGGPPRSPAQQPPGDVAFDLTYPSRDSAQRAEAAVRSCAAGADRFYRTGATMSESHRVVVFAAHATERDERVAACLRNSSPDASIRAAQGVQFRLN